jgi:uncharacterized protein YkwD
MRLILLIFFLHSTFTYSQLTDSDKNLFRTELFTKINELRKSKGLNPLRLNDTLKLAAQLHSEFMAKHDLLIHIEKENIYKTVNDRVHAFKGYDFELIGENVLRTSPKNFPLKKSDASKIATEMFNAWKNSPGHYENMIRPEFIFGDFGFSLNSEKNIIYVTHVFGKKGFVIKNQLSTDAFGLTFSEKECNDIYYKYSNLMYSMGNDLEKEGNDVNLYYHDIKRFKEILNQENDGLAIDLISKDQFSCGKENKLDFHPVYDGILLKPTYVQDIFLNNQAESEYRLISTIGEIPKNLSKNDYSSSLIFIKNGKACKYVYPNYVSRGKYALRPFEPITMDEQNIELVKEGVIESQILYYNFKTNKTKSIRDPEILSNQNNIHSIQIKSFSSVEGDSMNNQELYKSRSQYILNHLKSKLNLPEEVVSIEEKENWEQMMFQLNYFEQADLTLLKRDSLRQIIKKQGVNIPWDSLFFQQRKAVAIINYSCSYSESETKFSLGELNLRTGIKTNNISLVKKALYELYKNENYETRILFEPHIIEFMTENPETFTNYSALLSKNYFYSPYEVTKYLFSYLHQYKQLDTNAQINFLHLYTLLGDFFLRNWDISAKKLSQVVHPSKILKIIPKQVTPELNINLQLTFLQYYGQVNDYENISKSFHYIANYIKTTELKMEDDVNLVLFFNNWSMYNLTVEHLYKRFLENKINENGLFILAETLNFSSKNQVKNEISKIHRATYDSNPKRWCKWIEIDFQHKRNDEIKKMYCEYCN